MKTTTPAYRVDMHVNGFYYTPVAWRREYGRPTTANGFCRPEGATDADLTAAARLCVQMLEQQGLKTEWDGTNDQRIGVVVQEAA